MSEVKAIARTSDTAIFVVVIDGVERLEKRNRIPDEAFPQVERNYGGRRHWMTDAPECLPESENAAYNAALLPECDCYLVDDAGEHPLTTQKQIKDLKKLGWQETKQGAKRRKNEEFWKNYQMEQEMARLNEEEATNDPQYLRCD